MTSLVLLLLALQSFRATEEFIFNYLTPTSGVLPMSLFVCVLTAMPGLSCRFYQHRFPEVEDVVMVNVRSIAEMGAYVSLLEYNNIEGMILLSELSRRRIRSINKLIRIGRNECVVVIRVDKEKGGCGLT